MPLIFRQDLQHDGVLGIWQITEDEDILREALTLYEEEVRLIDSMKGEGRRREFLASRLLLHELSGRTERTKMIKDEYGKPYLPDSDHHISLSHSGSYAAVIASRRYCGIDIQVPVERIYRIFNRFASEREISACPDDAMDYMHLLWGAKECIFKAYGRGGVAYRDQIYVPDVLGMLEQECVATFCTSYAIQSYTMSAFKTREYYLTYCTER